MKEDRYVVHGGHGKMDVVLTVATYDEAVRAGKAVLKTFPDCGTVSITDRKGNVLKVVKKE